MPIHLLVDANELIDFLNQGEIEESSQNLSSIRDSLRECIDQIIEFKKIPTERLGRVYKGDVYRNEAELIYSIYRQIDSMVKEHVRYGEIGIFPGTLIDVDIVIGQGDVYLPDLRKSFSGEGISVGSTAKSGNYVLAFVSLLCDPKLGIYRIFKCEFCGKIGIATYRRAQRFCARSQCSAQYHNQTRKSTRADYMRKYRDTKKQMKKTTKK